MITTICCSSMDACQWSESMPVVAWLFPGSRVQSGGGQDRLGIHLSVVCLSICLSVCLSICLPVCCSFSVCCLSLCLLSACFQAAECSEETGRQDRWGIPTRRRSQQAPDRRTFLPMHLAQIHPLPHLLSSSVTTFPTFFGCRQRLCLQERTQWQEKGNQSLVLLFGCFLSDVGWSPVIFCLIWQY